MARKQQHQRTNRRNRRQRRARRAATHPAVRRTTDVTVDLTADATVDLRGTSSAHAALGRDRDVDGSVSRRRSTEDERRAARERHPSHQQGRSVVLVDIENLLGDDPRLATAAGVRATVEALVERADIRVGDLVFVACNPGLAPLVAGHIGSWQLRIRSGADGADQALLEVASDAFLQRSADRVVVASGDAAFTDLVQRCNHAGQSTVVVADARSTAGSLRRNAGRFLPFGRPAQFALAA